MHTISWVSWFFMTCMGVVNAAASDFLGVVEVDLVFPRNDTYAPAPYVPIVFGFQNTELAPLLNLDIELHVWNITNGSVVDQGSFGDSYHDLGWRMNTSSTDPLLVYRHYDHFNTEGIWRLVWTLTWSNCTLEPYWTGTNLTGYMQSSGITFTTRKSAQDIDLVTATEDQNCTEDQGIAFKIMNTEEAFDGGGRCAAVANYTVTPNPCRVKIDPAAASNISASLPEQLCSRRYPPIDCPSDKSAAQRLLVGGITFLMAAFGALSYILM
jgi:hypothetical protein